MDYQSVAGGRWRLWLFAKLKLELSFASRDTYLASCDEIPPLIFWCHTVSRSFMSVIVILVNTQESFEFNCVEATKATNQVC